MKTDLNKADCTYENGFPANINWDKPVVVQICEDEQGVVLHTCKVRGTQTKCFLKKEFASRYNCLIYFFSGV